MQKIILLLATTFLLANCSREASLNEIKVTKQDGVIYGTDSRKESLEVEDARLREVARSSVALVDRGSLEKLNDYTYASNGGELGERKNLCPSERYREQLTTAFCSGVLVEKNKILTAGHCMRNWASCSETQFVFNYERRSPHDKDPLIPAKNIYSCRRVLSIVADPSVEDYALVELDRDVEGITPQKLDFTATASAGEVVYTFGYPSGISKKYARGVMKTPPRRNYIRAALDVFGGNSGSPVYSQNTHKLIGIVTNGVVDYVYDRAKACNVVNNCGKGKCDGEWMYSVRALQSRLSPYLGKNIFEAP